MKQPKTPVVKLPHRKLSTIAEEILKDITNGPWSKHAAFYAAPYISAMLAMDKITDKYYLDSGKSVVLYFLSNASTWRGETARRIKLELKGMLL